MNDRLHFALIGERVEYSRSGKIFEAIFDRLNVSGRFEVHSVGREQLAPRIRQLVLDGIRGFSVSIPFKQEVIQYLDDVDPIAQSLAAVNSIWVDGDQLYGYNTDCYGFSVPLKEHLVRLKCAQALVLGCGGAARAVIYALYKDFDVSKFLVAGRSPKKLALVKQQLECRMENIDITPVSFEARQLKQAGSVALVVNCTPLGGWNYPDETPVPPDFDFGAVDVYYDLNYNGNNRIIQAARDAGIVTIDGSAMLVAQAIRSFDIWTGRSVEFQPIYDAVFSAA